VGNSPTVQKGQEALVPTYLNDKKLAQELLTGDESDFKYFFDEYFPRLYRFAYKRLSDNQDATEEIVQNTLSKTILNLNKYKGESTLFTWICAICKNEIYDFLKRQTKYQQNIVLKGEITDLDLTASAADRISPEQPEDRYLRHQKAVSIHWVLDQLPTNYGNVIEWKYIEGLSVIQIAQRLDMSQAAAQSILFRARKAFQDYYEELA